MNKFVWNGPKTNLGRFGFVEKGDVLLLTEHETSCIQDDKRYVPEEDAKIKTRPPSDALLRENNEEYVRLLSFKQMGREELLAHCEQIKAVDPEFQFRPDMKHETLIAKVITRELLAVRNPGEDEPEDETVVKPPAGEKDAPGGNGVTPPANPGPTDPSGQTQK